MDTLEFFARMGAELACGMVLGAAVMRLVGGDPWKTVGAPAMIAFVVLGAIGFPFSEPY